MDISRIGKRIEYARTSRDITLEDVAKAVGVAKSTIQRYEKGKIETPKLPVLHSIANALNVNPAWLVCKSDEMDIAPVMQDSIYAQMNSAFSAEDVNHFKTFEQLNTKNKEKVDNYTQSILHIQMLDESASAPIAAHLRTDVTQTPEGKKHDDDIMMNDDEWM